MSEILRGVALRPRLAAALSLLPRGAVVADIGCDHGRLGVALVQQDPDARCIATDVSAPSLEKARALAAHAGVAARMDFRVGDGFLPLQAGEIAATAICGMGGALIVRMLDACDTPLAGAQIAVFQPMRGVADLRRYLWERGYWTLDDRVVLDAGRYYQVFCAAPPRPDGARQPRPAGFPADCFEVGYTAFALRDPMLQPLALQMLRQHEKRLQTARGTSGEADLLRRAADMQAILERWDEHAAH